MACCKMPPKDEIDDHEWAHHRACVGQRIGHKWVKRGRIWVIEGSISPGKSGSRKGAIELYAGYLAGGGDDKGDEKAALELAREAGMSTSELRSAAMKYASQGSQSSGCLVSALAMMGGTLGFIAGVVELVRHVV